MRLDNLKASPLVAAAAEARRPTRWWLAYLFGVVGSIMVAGSLVSTITGALLRYTDTSITAQIAEGFMFLGSFLALAAWVRFKEGRAVPSLGFRGSAPLRRFVLGVGIGAALLTVSVLVLLILGQYRQSAPSAHMTVGIGALVPVVLLVLVWSVQASTEETVTRGYFIQVGGLQLPGWLALLVPGLIFSGLHFIQIGFGEPLAALNILFFAMFAGLVALRQGSLWLVCGVHTGWNWFQGNVFGLPVSGNPPKDTTLFLFAPTETADRWLSGGAFGPEGSLVVTVIWGCALVLAYQYFRAGTPTERKVGPV